MIFRSFVVAALAAAVALPAAAQPAGEAAFRATLKEMVETDTSIATGDCTVLVNRIVARMTAAGFPASDLHVIIPDGNPKAGNLVAVLPGRDPKAKAVLMLGHIDVVNARREDWVRDPFTLIEENGQLYGRGVSDMKAQDAIWADNIMRYHAEGYRPARTIKMALTCGEEAASFLNGAAWLAGHQRDLIDAGIALTEGGGGVLDANGKRLAVTVMAAEKGGGNVVLEVTGPGGHSSLPKPDNAIITLGAALGRLKTVEYPTELNAFSRAYLTALAPRVDPESGAAMRKILTDPQDPAAIAVLNRSVAWHAMLRTTCIPTLIEGGHAPNAQPQRARATINCRTLPGSSMDPAVAAIVKAVNDPSVKVSVVTAGPPVPPGGVAPPRPVTPPLTPEVMDPIQATAAKVFPGVPVTPMQETFGTDSGRLISVGIPTFGVSGLFRGDDAGNIHGLNEHLAVASLMDGREFLYRLVKAYAEQK